VRYFLSAAAITLASSQALLAQAPATRPAAGDYVSREEYDRLRREQDDMRRELEALKRERAAAPANAAGAGAADLDAVNKSIQEIRDDIARIRPGESTFTLLGDAAFGYTVARHTPSTFYASLAPLVLWKPAERILVEAAADIGVSTDPNGGSSTSFDLKIANASYLVNDYLAVGAGLFIVPFGQYHNHFDPPWINKFPDDPLPFGDGGIAPNSEVGVFVKGAIPIAVESLNSKLTYDIYATNGPNLNTADPAAAGSLSFDDFTDLNGNKAFGGRIGFLPVSNVEVGYSIQSSEPNPAGFKRVHALLQAVDLNWRQDIEPLYGRLDVRGEYVWSDISRTTFDPTGSLGFGPTSFNNKREGGYVQVGFRPIYVDHPFFRNVELVARYDFLNTPLNAPGGEHEHRFTIGADYWVTPQAVFKVAYEFDFRDKDPNQDALMVQFGLRL
jgi:hypothetical protein